MKKKLISVLIRALMIVLNQFQRRINCAVFTELF